MIERAIAECAKAVPIGAYADRAAAHYLFVDGNGVYAVSEDSGASPLRAVSSVLPLFSWDEREMAQERAIAFDRMPDARPLRTVAGEMPAAKVAQGEGMMRFVVGPVHAGIIEPGRFTFSSGGETVVYLDAQLGYAHRGIERHLEGVDAVDAAKAIARICGGCSAARSFAYARAIERLAQFAPNAAIELARLVVAELERVYNHLADLAASASAAGYASGFTQGMALKEKAMQLCFAASGHRLLFDAIVPGGVAPGLLGDRGALASGLRELERNTQRYADRLFANTSLVSRWQHSGVVSREMAKAFGAVGPAHRASRGTLDVRTFAPYGAYRSIPVTVALASAGDVLARCRVKRDELRESFRLTLAALTELGDAALPPVETLDVQPGVARSIVEGPRGSEAIAVHVGGQGRIERFHAISASYRNWPVVARAMENNIVPDFPLVNKSFNLCYACVDR